MVRPSPHRVVTVGTPSLGVVSHRVTPCAHTKTKTKTLDRDLRPEEIADAFATDLSHGLGKEEPDRNVGASSAEAANVTVNVDSEDTANLQSPRLTVKDAARLMNVSERMVYVAGVVLRLRPDLAAKVEAGTMSMNEAHRIATGKAKATSWDRLVRAWNNASDDDRARLALLILKDRRAAS